VHVGSHYEEEVKVIDNFEYPHSPLGRDWTIYTGSSGTVSTVTGAGRRGYVMQTTTSYGTEFGLRYPASGDLYLDRRNLSVWIKDSDTFYFYVKVHGDDGDDYFLRYDPLSGSPYTTGSNDEYVVIPVGTKYKDGTWRELRRDLEADFHLMYPAIDIEYIIRVSIRGDFYLDDLRFFDQKKYFYAAGQRVAMRANDEVYYFLTDHLGSTNITLDASGTKIAELRYMPWGDTRFEYNETPTSYRYTGQREDASINLIQMGARWFDPLLGRFISADTIVPSPYNPLAYDRYAYSYNNPLKFIDPTGHEPEFPMIEGLWGSPYAFRKEHSMFQPYSSDWLIDEQSQLTTAKPTNPAQTPAPVPTAPSNPPETPQPTATPKPKSPPTESELAGTYVEQLHG
jgi:RHS repeat-associated protein